MKLSLLRNINKCPLLSTSFIVLLLPILIHVVLDALITNLHAHDLEGSDVDTHLVLLALKRSAEVDADAVKHGLHSAAGNNLLVMRLEHEEKNTAWEHQERIVQRRGLDLLQNREDVSFGGDVAEGEEDGVALWRLGGCSKGALVQLLDLLLALFLKEDLLLTLVPDSDALVVAGTNQEVAAVGDSDGPYFAMVAVQSLDLLELVAIPVPDRAVLATTKKVMAVAIVVVRYKCDLKNTVLVSKKGLVAVTKVETPYPDVLVG
ncbi:hypothetical protein HG530_003196 [Fusarium avenaceum]|nr:hypothetical protein HG530_003196 [Fusarium avenaceum]